MTGIQLGQGPAPLTVRLDNDDPTTLEAKTLDGSDWPTPVTLVFNDDAETSFTATVSADTATWGLQAEDATALIGALPQFGKAHIVAGASDDIVAAGPVIVGTGWQGDPNAPQGIATVLVGPPGPAGTGSGSDVTWGTLAGKPATYPPTIGTTADTALAGDTAIPSTAADIGAATTAQGAKADTAVQPADLDPYAKTVDLPATVTVTDNGDGTLTLTF